MCRSGTSFLIALMILARSLGAGTWRDACGAADIDRFSSIHRTEFLRGEADGMIAGTFQFEASPIVRNGLRTISLKHVPFGRSQGMSNSILLCQMSVKTLHQIERRRVLDGPKRGDDGLGACQLKCQREICVASSSFKTTDCGVAS